LPVTVSIGVAMLSKSGDTVGTLLKRADDALYAAKNSGRNRVVTEPEIAGLAMREPIAIAS
jgi:two-component system cell cycle response regulator